MILVVGATVTAAAALLVGAWMAWFVAGGFYAVMVAVSMTTFELIDPVGRHYWQGRDGELSTARQLRRCRRSGWRTVHNVALLAGDIDHVAVGPGGVIAVETKSSDSEWAWLMRQRIAHRWAQQASSSATRTRALVKQHTGMNVEVTPVVSAWVRGLDEDGPVVVNGVTVVHGSRLSDFLSTLTAEFGAEQVERVHESLEAYAQQLDQHRAVRQSAYV